MVKKKSRLKRLGIVLLILLLAVGAWMIVDKVIFRPVFSENAKTRHLVVISVDALDARDFEVMKTLPNFKQIMDSGSYAREVVSVYPSLTYPSHTSIATGTYPDRHGVFANELNEPGIREQSWHWYKKEIKVPTIYDIAKKSHMDVATLFWPVTAGARVDYNIPEIWPVKGESQTWLTLKNGSPLFLLTAELKFGKLRDGSKQPMLDNYTAASAAYLMRSKKPNLSMIHFTDLDHQRHKHGLNSPEAMDALKRMDDRIGQIIEGAKDGGIYDETTFIILGDHGFMDADYMIRVNTEFTREGLITADANGKVTDWKAYTNYCDGSAQVYLKDPGDSQTLKKVGEILDRLKNDPNSGIEAVYTKEQAAAKRVTGDFVYMLEAKSGYFFMNDWTGDLVVKIDKNNIIEDDDYSYQSTHGYDPTKPGYRTFFMASGPGIRKGVVLPSINLVDEGPTMAALLGLEMPDTDGVILKEILED